MNEIIPLGINGFFPYNCRQTACYLVIKNETVIILDAGSGISGLLSSEIKKKIQGKHLHIILSHYHLDHTCGLSYIPGVVHDNQITLYCPVKPLVKTKNSNILKKLLSPPLYSLKLENLPITIKDINSNKFKINDINISLIKQYHPDGSVGIRIDDDIVYITDTVVSDNTAKFAKNVKLLLHEIWITDKELKTASLEADGKKQEEKHSFESGAVKIALSSGCKGFMPIHMPPHRTQNEIKSLVNRIAAKGINVYPPIEFTPIPF
ncbi:MAG: MBL fold metallo-hydrolase [bacterium]